jgi:transcriptional antiterminator RfaH
MMNWYVVHTQPHQETMSESSLQRLGIETFLPRFKQRKIIRRVVRTAVAPLFPGYLFARFNLNTDYRAVNFARGVRRIVLFGSVPALVDDSIIGSIKARLQEDGIALQGHSFVPGQSVRIQGGAFQGLEAVFERELSDHQRAMVLLQMLSGQARVIVDMARVANL